MSKTFQRSNRPLQVLRDLSIWLDLQNFIVFENGKTIYLHRDNLDYQLQKYLWLKNNYKNFAGIYEIDLGSQTQNRVIIKE